MSNHHTILLFAQNKRGVLERITMIIRRKMYNLEQITASQTQIEGISRVTVTFSHQEGAKIPQIIEQLKKIIEVTDVKDISSLRNIKREIALIKVKRPSHLSEILAIVDLFKAEVVHIDEDSLIIQGVGDTHKISDFYRALQEFEILEYGSSGSVGMEI